MVCLSRPHSQWPTFSSQAPPPVVLCSQLSWVFSIDGLITGEGRSLLMQSFPQKSPLNAACFRTKPSIHEQFAENILYPNHDTHALRTYSVHWYDNCVRVGGGMCYRMLHINKSNFQVVHSSQCPPHTHTRMQACPSAASPDPCQQLHMYCCRFCSCCLPVNIQVLQTGRNIQDLRLAGFAKL